VFGVGFTVMENVRAVPLQPAAAGVTIIFPTAGAPLLLVPVNDGMLPVPPLARPIV
jgi:hypothetical protein